MSIKDIHEKIKPYWTEKAAPMISRLKASLDIKEDLFIVISIILIGLAGFGLGKLSALEKGRGEVSIKPAQMVTLPDGSKDFVAIDKLIEKSAVENSQNAVPISAAALVASESAKGLLVASKSGTKYHFPWCSGASQITEKNKIWFNSYEEAQKAGYTAASNCKGLK